MKKLVAFIALIMFMSVGVTVAEAIIPMPTMVCIMPCEPITTIPISVFGFLFNLGMFSVAGVFAYASMLPFRRN